MLFEHVLLILHSNFLFLKYELIKKASIKNKKRNMMIHRQLQNNLFIFLITLMSILTFFINLHCDFFKLNYKNYKVFFLNKCVVLRHILNKVLFWYHDVFFFITIIMIKNKQDIRVYFTFIYFFVLYKPTFIYILYFISASNSQFIIKLFCCFCIKLRHKICSSTLLFSFYYQLIFFVYFIF